MLLKPGLTFTSIRHSQIGASGGEQLAAEHAETRKAGPSGPSPSPAAREPGTGQSSRFVQKAASCVQGTQGNTCSRRGSPTAEAGKQLQPPQCRAGKRLNPPPPASWSQASWWKSRGSHQRCTAPARGLICLQDYLITSQTASSPHGHRLRRKSPVNSSKHASSCPESPFLRGQAGRSLRSSALAPVSS